MAPIALRFPIATVTLIALILGGTTSACTTLDYQSSVVRFHPKTRIAVLQVDQAGKIERYNFERPVVYRSFLDAQLIPVALNEFDIETLRHHLDEAESGPKLPVASAEEGVQLPQSYWWSEPAVHHLLREMMQNYRIKYLFLIHSDGRRLNEVLKMVVLSDSLAVVAAKEYSYRAQWACWAALTPVFGLSLGVCPATYFIDDQDFIAPHLRDFLQAYGG